MLPSYSLPTPYSQRLHQTPHPMHVTLWQFAPWPALQSLSRWSETQCRFGCVLSLCDTVRARCTPPPGNPECRPPGVRYAMWLNVPVAKGKTHKPCQCHEAPRGPLVKHQKWLGVQDTARCWLGDVELVIPSTCSLVEVRQLACQGLTAT